VRALLASGQFTMRKVDGWRDLIEQSPKQVLASPRNEVTSSRWRIFPNSFSK